MRRITILLLCSGCAHFSEAAMAGQTCEVMRGNEVAHVVTDIAYVKTWTAERRIVRYEAGDRIHRTGVVANEVGHFDGQRLISKGPMRKDSGEFADGEVKVGAAVFEYAPGCSSRDAALGVMALIVHEAS